jgi:hypothetical protein
MTRSSTRKSTDRHDVLSHRHRVGDVTERLEAKAT